MKKSECPNDWFEAFLMLEQLLEREISSRSVIHNVLITTKGLKYNEYSGFFDNVITLDELFS